MEGFVKYLTYAAAFFALVAALFWFWSSAVSLPKTLHFGWDSAGESHQELLTAVKHQSKLSAFAALAAGTAAVCEIIYLAFR